MKDRNRRPQYISRFRRRFWSLFGWWWLAGEIAWKKMTAWEYIAHYAPSIAENNRRVTLKHLSGGFFFTWRNSNPTGWPFHHRAQHLFVRMLPWWNRSHRDHVIGLKPIHRRHEN